MAEDRPSVKVFARMQARSMALERAIQHLGADALPAQLLQEADHFYPFIAQEILGENE